MAATPIAPDTATIPIIAAREYGGGASLGTMG
jgi:hypothetical protein